MRFLCPNHQRKLFTLSEGKMIGLWFEWMNQAALYYETQQWREAVSYSGCSLELALIYLQKADELSHGNALKKVSLAAIYCCNALCQKGDNQKSCLIKSRACQLMADSLSKGNNQNEKLGYLDILKDNELEQTHFFEQHLNLPIEYQANKLH